MSTDHTAPVLSIARGTRQPAAEPDRPVTVRLEDSTLTLVTAFAKIDSSTVAEQIRTSSREYIAQRLRDPELERRKESARARLAEQLAPLQAEDSTARADSGSPILPPHVRVGAKGRTAPVTLRLDAAVVEQLTALAVLDGTTVADQLREAVQNYVQARRQDPGLARSVKRAFVAIEHAARVAVN